MRAFLANFSVVDLSPAIAERTVILRREHRLRIPDAIIWASAQVEGRLLVSRDERAFPVEIQRFGFRTGCDGRQAHLASEHPATHPGRERP